MKWQKLQKIFGVIFLILIFASIIVYQTLSDSFSLDIAREHLKDFGVWTPLIFIAVYTIGTIFIPSTPFMAVAGILFGLKYGLLYTVIGGFLSSLLVFAISRKLGKNQVEALLQNKYLKYLDKYNKRLGSGGFWDLVILRIAPIMPFNVLNILMGLSKIKTGTYILGTLIGLAPSNVLAVYFGDIVAKIF